MSARSNLLIGSLFTLGLIVCAVPQARAAAVDDDTVCLLDGETGTTLDGENISPRIANCIKNKDANGGRMPVATSFWKAGTFVPSKIRISEYKDTSIISAADPTTGATISVSDVPYKYSSWIANVGDFRDVAAQRFSGVRVSKMNYNANEVAQTPIDAHYKCRYVDNYTGNDIFVPFRTEDEWEKFIASFSGNSHENGKIVLSPCALPFSGKCELHGLFYGPTGVPSDDSGDSDWYPVDLPYGRDGDVWPKPGTETIAVNGQNVKINEHTFNYSCYQDVPVDHCFDTSQQYATECSSGGSSCPTPAGTCTCQQVPTCVEKGTICQKDWHDYSETWNFIAKANSYPIYDPTKVDFGLACGFNNTIGSVSNDSNDLYRSNGCGRIAGWDRVESRKISGSRPDNLCSVRGWQDGHNCNLNPPPPPPPTTPIFGGDPYVPPPVTPAPPSLPLCCLSNQ